LRNDSQFGDVIFENFDANIKETHLILSDSNSESISDPNTQKLSNSDNKNKNDTSTASLHLTQLLTRFRIISVFSVCSHSLINDVINSE